MESQRNELEVCRPLQGKVYPSSGAGTASEIRLDEILQRLHDKLHPYFSGPSSRSDQKLIWFCSLYLASLLSFSGLISAVRWTLELL